MRSRIGRPALVIGSALVVLVLYAAPASAAPVLLFEASDFFIPRPASATDQEGVERQLEDFDLAANGFADLVGQECRFTVSADNGESVNENNYAVLRSADWETDVYGTESAPNETTTFLEDDTHVLGPTVEMFNVMIPDDMGTVGTSVDFVVFVDCAAQAVTTTTPTTPTTTETTLPTTSTTVAATETTTTVASPSTTISEQQSSSTTAPTTTSTTAPGSATSEGSTTTIPPATPGTLPFTGPGNDVALMMSALALLVLGAGGVAAARPRGRHSR